MTRSILVYADWEPLPDATGLGTLYAHAGGGKEVFEFEFDQGAISNTQIASVSLDPRLGFYGGRQHPAHGQTFGLFADASPDRWGRLLMKRRLERDQRAGTADPKRRLVESDYLLGVHDEFRVGGLRFRVGDDGDFLDNRSHVAAPPFVQLRELEAAVSALERDQDNTAPAGGDWLRMLIAPGGSLGGARPKASVIDPNGRLWIAKFPSLRDECNVGAWELVVQTLARQCGLNVPASLARQFASSHHTFLVQRFDRTAQGRRLHFASAMTLTGHSDGDDADSGVSYLELARVLIDHGARTSVDLRELWTRILFNVLVSNTDDHLRNHGFILEPGRGWRLSEAYDMNPVPGSSGLKLNISESDNALDIDLVLSVAHYFRVMDDDALAIMKHCVSVVRQWRKVATALKLAEREQNSMAPAFELAE
ncbi:MAG: HipA domain-containing protein [Pseudomonadota bacterium]